MNYIVNYVTFDRVQQQFPIAISFNIIFQSEIHLNFFIINQEKNVRER